MPGRIMTGVVALLIDGLRRFSPGALPPDHDVDALLGDDTGVALEPYRAMLDAVYARGGGVSLLRAGRALDDLADPILFVLLNSDSVDVMIEKQARLVRFIHSRHVVRIVERSASGVTLEHASTVSDPPRITEDLAGAGQHIALLEQIGCRGLRLRFPRTRDAGWVYRDGVYTEPDDGPCDLWAFAWDQFSPTRRPMPGLDELLLASESRPELDEISRTVAAVERIVRADLGRTWTLAAVAKSLDTSPRSLQRALAAEQARFSKILDRTRVEEAMRLLTSTELSVTEIGYVCGFADTSHFSRRFKGRVGATPSAYRARSRD